LEIITPACQIARKTRTPAIGVSIFSSLIPSRRALFVEVFCGAMVLPDAVEHSHSIKCGHTIII
jgi:hypothetical protein